MVVTSRVITLILAFMMQTSCNKAQVIIDESEGTTLVESTIAYELEVTYKGNIVEVDDEKALLLLVENIANADVNKAVNTILSVEKVDEYKNKGLVVRFTFHEHKNQKISGGSTTVLAKGITIVSDGEQAYSSVGWDGNNVRTSHVENSDIEKLFEILDIALES